MRKFAWVPLAALLDERLSDRHIRVLLALGSFANLQTSEAFPSQTQIGKRAGRKRQAVNAAFKDLRELGYVEWEARTDRIGRRSSNRYRILFESAAPTSAVDLNSTADVDAGATPILEQTRSKKDISHPARETSPLSSDWHPDEQSRALGEDLGFDQSALGDLRTLFTDFWMSGDRANSELRSDWNAEFRRFLRHQAARLSSNRRPRGSSNGSNGSAEGRRRPSRADLHNRRRAAFVGVRNDD